MSSIRFLKNRFLLFSYYFKNKYAENLKFVPIVNYNIWQALKYFSKNKIFFELSLVNFVNNTNIFLFLKVFIFWKNIFIFKFEYKKLN